MFQGDGASVLARQITTQIQGLRRNVPFSNRVRVGCPAACKSAQGQQKEKNGNKRAGRKYRSTVDVSQSGRNHKTNVKARKS
jgi:hypothetical protein